MKMQNRFQNEIRASQSFEEGPFFLISDSEDDLRIFAHGIVGDRDDMLDSQSVVKTILENRGRPIVLDINTPGGAVFDAVAIYTALVEHDATVRADITGKAESSGTILVSAADSVRIAQAGLFTVHQAWTGFVSIGNKRQIRQESEEVYGLLDKVDDEISQILADRSGRPKDEIDALMAGKDGSDGTSFTGSEAVEMGFADELIPNKKRPETRGTSQAYIRQLVNFKRKRAA